MAVVNDGPTRRISRDPLDPPERLINANLDRLLTAAHAARNVRLGKRFPAH